MLHTTFIPYREFETVLGIRGVDEFIRYGGTMVVHNPETLTCEIYEIKLSREVVPDQYRHLNNAEKCTQTEHRFGKITGKFVIYRGIPTDSDGVHYLNVEDYLKSLS